MMLAYNPDPDRNSDTMKGSYYANPVLDEPSVPEELRNKYPEYYGKNICTGNLILYDRIVIDLN